MYSDSDEAQILQNLNDLLNLTVVEKNVGLRKLCIGYKKRQISAIKKYKTATKLRNRLLDEINDFCFAMTTLEAVNVECDITVYKKEILSTREIMGICFVIGMMMYFVFKKFYVF